MYKVLLVEDEIQIRAGLKKLIEDVIGGYRVVKEAESGREALDWLKTAIPDLIVTDIRMKDVNGIELIERVRAQYPDLAILIISGYNDFEYAKQAIRLRVEDYLLKPVDRVELTQYLTALRTKLDGHGSRAPNDAGGAAAADRFGENEKRVIRTAKSLIQAHLDQDVSLQFIADKVHMNRQYLSSLFKQETGQNFVDYVIACRMDRAKKLLRETNLKIYEVAKLSGYENAKYFMTVFKQLVGATPSDYRERPSE